MKPPLVYFGGKATLADRIVAALPPHQHYVEPYSGSLAVLLAKPKAPFETVNDLDGHLMGFWRVLRDRPDELSRACALTPHSRAEHKASLDLGVDDEVERARRVWVQLTQGRAGSLRPTGWRHFKDPAATGAGMPQYLRGYVGRMRAAAGRLADVSLESRDALDVIRDYGQHTEVCIYADPPYLGTTRGRGSQYPHDMRDAAAHIALAEALRACRAGVVLSGYDSPLYEDLYAGWSKIRIPTTTGNGGDTRDRVEVLWSNRPVERHLLSDLTEGAG